MQTMLPNPQNQQQIGLYTANKQKQIGRGSYGIVYEAAKEGLQEKICCKVLRLHQSNPKQIQQLQREMEILSSLIDYDNPSLVKIYNVMQNPNTEEVFIFMELCNQGDMDQDWRKRKQRDQQYSLVEIKLVFSNIVKAYKTLYERQIIHRDIKLANILLSSQGPKLSDFGLGKKIDDMDLPLPQTRVGTPINVAPQLYLDDKFSSKCDFGTVLYQLTFMEPYTQASSQQEIVDFLRQIKQQPIKCRRPAIIGDDMEIELLRQLIDRMLLFDEEQRISWPELFQHPFAYLQSNDRLNIQYLDENSNIYHFINICLAKLYVSNSLLEIAFEHKADILLLVNGVSYNLFITCVLGYQSKLLINLYGFLFNQQNDISKKIQPYFNNICQELKRINLDDTPKMTALKSQVNSFRKLKEQQFQQQRNQLIELLQQQPYKTPLQNFITLLGLTDDSRFVLYTQWFKHFYLSDFRDALKLEINTEYIPEYIKFIALCEYFMTIDTEFPIEAYESQNQYRITEILGYHVNSLRGYIEYKRSLN